MSDLLTYEEAALLAGISSVTLRLWVKRGVLPKIAVPASNYRRVRRGDLERLLTPSVGPPRGEEPSGAA